MTTRNLFAYDPSGSVLVVLDGKEVLVHRGADEAPKWRREIEAEVIGLGAGDDTVVTLESNGKLTWWSGAVQETADVGEGATALAVTADGRACALVLAVAAFSQCQ